jgi:lysyl-tRNA synthetase class 1
MCPTQRCWPSISAAADPIPDPFGTHESFAHHNNAMLRAFLDRFGFDYEFLSATDCYARAASTRRSAGPAQVGRDHGRHAADAARGRRQTYSPVLADLARHGRVLQASVEVMDAELGLIAFTDEDGTRIEQSALGGRAKLQWKVDWAMLGWRWASIMKWPARI